MTTPAPNAAAEAASAVESRNQSAPRPPSYGEGTLAEVGQSLLASLGAPGEGNALGLPAASAACVLLVDGMGWDLLARNADAAPFLAGPASAGRCLTAGFPATTATSLSSLGTGRAPGQHGVLGYQVRVPDSGKLLNALRWDAAVDPVAWQPGSTIFERATAAGLSAIRVAQGAFQRTGLSEASMRGADYRAANTLGALAARTLDALAGRPRGFVLTYTGDLDATGHAWGCGSAAWRYQLRHTDALAAQIAEALPAGIPLYITADHGMVDVPPDRRIDVDSLPPLQAGVAVLGGEPRARHVYAEPGAADDVLAAWTNTLGTAAWVVSREQAIDEGWFGPVDMRCAARIGDVIAAARDDWAIVATATEPRESALVGMHGSLALADQQIPLLTYQAD